MSRSDLLAALGLGLMSSVVVQIGFSSEAVHDPRQASFHFDGGHYLQIAESGYFFDPARASNIAFFPGYPLLGKLIAAATGSSARTALWCVSQISLIAALAFFSAFLRTKPDLPRRPCLLALATWPPGVCFHVGYSEGLLLALLALLMLGLAKNWSPLWLAVIAGAATGVRAVGFAASVTVFVHILLHRNWRQAVMLAPITAWGLIAFMAYQWIEFGSPLAFMQTQRHWTAYQPEHASPLDKTIRLMILEPIWGSYVPGSPRHWSRFNGDESALYGSGFWNPILFALAGLLVIVGWFKRWLSRDEVILAAGLLMVPYASRADEQSMLSHARFAAVVLPMYVVMGKLIRRVPWLVAIFAAGLALWASLFAADAPLL